MQDVVPPRRTSLPNEPSVPLMMQWRTTTGCKNDPPRRPSAFRLLPTANSLIQLSSTGVAADIAVDGNQDTEVPRKHRLPLSTTPNTMGKDTTAAVEKTAFRLFSAKSAGRLPLGTAFRGLCRSGNSGSSSTPPCGQVSPSLSKNKKDAPPDMLTGPLLLGPHVGATRLSSGSFSSTLSRTPVSWQPLEAEGELRWQRAYSLDQTSPSQQLRRCRTIETPTIYCRSVEGVDQVNQYKVTDLLGKGAYGTVRVAEDQNCNRFAIKSLSKKRLKKKGFGDRRPGKSPAETNSESLSDLKREVAILTNLSHPHVVRLFEVMDDPAHDIVYMVFELLELGPVLDLSRPNCQPLTEKKACLYFRQLVLALEFLHHHHVIHRDIKPANLLLSTPDVIKVADFGVSHIFDGQDATLTKTAGTPAFMSPEMIEVTGGRYDGRLVDIWAAGVTLFTFLFGCTPWSGSNKFLLYKCIRDEKLVFPVREDGHVVSKEALELMRRLMDKNVLTRIHMTELREDSWVTCFRSSPLVSAKDNCTPLQLTEDHGDENSLTCVTTCLRGLALAKAMLSRRSFASPRHARGPAASTSSALASQHSSRPLTEIHRDHAMSPLRPTSYIPSNHVLQATAVVAKPREMTPSTLGAEDTPSRRRESMFPLGRGSAPGSLVDLLRRNSASVFHGPVGKESHNGDDSGISSRSSSQQSVFSPSPTLQSSPQGSRNRLACLRGGSKAQLIRRLSEKNNSSCV